MRFNKVTIQPQKVNVLVLMGQNPNEDNPICSQEKVLHKALALVNKKPIIYYVLKALKEAKSVRDITICTNTNIQLEEHLPQTLLKGVTQTFLCADTPAGTVEKHVNDNKVTLPLFVITSDLALLNADIVDDFVKKALRDSEDINVGFINMTHLKTAFPETKRTYIKCRDGWFSSCNLFLFKNSKAKKIFKECELLSQYRKNMLKLVYHIGIWRCISYFFRFQRLKSAMNAFTSKYDISCAPILLEHANVGVDVDKIEDLELVRQYMIKGKS